MNNRGDNIEIVVKQNYCNLFVKMKIGIKSELQFNGIFAKEESDETSPPKNFKRSPQSFSSS